MTLSVAVFWASWIAISRRTFNLHNEIIFFSLRALVVSYKKWFPTVVQDVFVQVWRDCQHDVILRVGYRSFRRRISFSQWKTACEIRTEQQSSPLDLILMIWCAFWSVYHWKQKFAAVCQVSTCIVQWFLFNANSGKKLPVIKK